ncbi:MAG: HK97 gp10 family phage protein [Clostridiales Family XIII bacterium]|nr:HK97 gp10 family phage protein [Clostridia bacterium]MDY3011480.1 HK97 gp10 family phage protein [Clostridiales Family XIII bacterium]
MGSTVRIDQLASEITKCLNQYTDEVTEALEQTKGNLAKEGVKKLKATSPKDKGDYAKSWTRKKTKKGQIIHNKRYQLTHLLENGHAKRNGGRVAAVVHIAPVEDELAQKAAAEFERILK